MGPECVAQQKKFVASRIRNCGDRSTVPRDMPSMAASAPAGIADAAAASSAGGRRTSSDTGIISRATSAASTRSVVRQGWFDTSHAASGAIVIGAMPMPAETSDTARLRLVSNQPVTVAIIGAKIAAQEAPTKRPNTNWNAMSEVAWLAANRLSDSTIDPVRTTGSGPNLSDAVPQAMLVKAIARKPIVIALEMPVTDQPVSLVIGCRNTGSENMPPIATQPSRPPAATITQR